MIDHETLERRLREAADPSLWDGVSPDAWQQNERRIAADRSRTRRRFSVIAAAAAAVIAVGGGALVASQVDGGSTPAPPSGGDKHRLEDPAEPDDLVGKVVVLERYTANGSTVVHSAFLTRAGGKGLSLCDEYKGPDTATSSSGSGSCTASSPGPSKPKVNAFAFITSNESSDRSASIGVTGAVERRVASLKAWVGDSADARDVPLHTLGVNGLKAFGVTTLGGRAPVVRIVAYGDDGVVLQIFDAPGYFGEEWLPDGECVDVTLPVGAGICVSSPVGQPATQQREGNYLAVVTGPEVGELRITIGKKTLVSTPTPSPRSPWGVVVVPDTGPDDSVIVNAKGSDGSSLDSSAMQYYRVPTD